MAHGHHHIIPQKTLLKVFGWLVFLTVLTVLTARYLDLGPFNVPLALAIAGTKATLVVSVFMALKYDKQVNVLVFVVGTLFVVVFLAHTLFDTLWRGDLGNVGRMTIQDEARIEEQLREREPRPEDLRVTPSDFEQGTEAAQDTVATQ